MIALKTVRAVIKTTSSANHSRRYRRYELSACTLLIARLTSYNAVGGPLDQNRSRSLCKHVLSILPRLGTLKGNLSGTIKVTTCSAAVAGHARQPLLRQGKGGCHRVRSQFWFRRSPTHAKSPHGIIDSSSVVIAGSYY